MRRSTRFGLAAVLGLLVLCGAYTAYWWIVAARTEDGLVAWQQSMRGQKIDASWQSIHISGFPFHFRIALTGAALRDHALTPSPEVHLAELTGSARPWDFADWRLEAPRGIRSRPRCSRQPASGKAGGASRRGRGLARPRRRYLAVAQLPGRHRRGRRPGSDQGRRHLDWPAGKSATDAHRTEPAAGRQSASRRSADAAPDLERHDR